MGLASAKSVSYFASTASKSILLSESAQQVVDAVSRPVSRFAGGVHGASARNGRAAHVPTVAHAFVVGVLNFARLLLESPVALLGACCLLGQAPQPFASLGAEVAHNASLHQ